MKTLAAIYTGQGLAEPLQKIMDRKLPGVRVISIIDDSIIKDVVKAGKPEKEVFDRLIGYYKAAEFMGADLILNTCSSVGDVVYRGREEVSIPIIRIDEAMARKAVTSFDKIGVIATLQTTLDPTVRLLQMESDRAGRKIEIADGLAKGAYDALLGGSPDKHDELIALTAQSICKKVDSIVLAQGSMARMEKALAEMTGLPVYSSPALCIEEIALMMGRP